MSIYSLLFPAVAGCADFGGIFMTVVCCLPYRFLCITMWKYDKMKQRTPSRSSPHILAYVYHSQKSLKVWITVDSCKSKSHPTCIKNLFCFLSLRITTRHRKCILCKGHGARKIFCSVETIIIETVPSWDGVQCFFSFHRSLLRHCSVVSHAERAANFLKYFLSGDLSRCIRKPFTLIVLLRERSRIIF